MISVEDLETILSRYLLKVLVYTFIRTASWWITSILVGILILKEDTIAANTPYAAGWYIVFGTAVPVGKPVTVLHNFDK